MLDGLVGRTVFAQADTVVGIYPDAGIWRESRQAHRRPHVIGKYKEGCAEGNGAGGQIHAVHDATHGMLAYSEMDAAPLRG